MNYRNLREQAPVAAQHDVFALAALAGLYGGYLPWSSASLRPSAIQILVNDIILNRRTRLVEFGTGISTIYLAAAVIRNGGRIISIDHDRPWQVRTAEWLPEAARPNVNFVYAPLRAIQPGIPEGIEWYDVAVVQNALKSFGRADLVLFDGPPAYDEARSFARRPGLSVIKPQLAESATIVLDDINRAGEQTIAREWSASLQQPHRDLQVRAGIALWSLGPSYHVL